MIGGLVAGGDELVIVATDVWVRRMVQRAVVVVGQLLVTGATVVVARYVVQLPLLGWVRLHASCN